MTQPSLLDLPQQRPRKAGHVPRTSVLAFMDQPRDARVMVVLRQLQRFVTSRGCCPTSAELVHLDVQGCSDRALLYFRRGLSDALRLGLAEHAGTRKCTVSGRTCLTWAVRSR